MSAKKTFITACILGALLCSGPITCMYKIMSIERDVKSIGSRLNRYDQKDWSDLFAEAAHFHSELAGAGSEWNEWLKRDEMPEKMKSLGFSRGAFNRVGFDFELGVSGGNSGVYLEVILHPELKRSRDRQGQQTSRGVHYINVLSPEPRGFVFIDSPKPDDVSHSSQENHKDKNESGRK